MKETEFDKDVKKAITAEHRKELKDDLRSLEDSLAKSQQGSRKFNWRIAASIAVLIGLGSWFVLFNQEPSPEALYNQYFSPYENVVAPIVRDQVNLSKKAQAFANYEQGLYQKAIDGLDALTAQDSLDVSSINFYKANAYLKLFQFEQAKLLLEQVVDQSKEWKAESLWYLALISLKLNDIEASLSQLKRLQEIDSVFKSKEIEHLLEQLE